MHQVKREIAVKLDLDIGVERQVDGEQQQPQRGICVRRMAKL